MVDLKHIEDTALPKKVAENSVTPVVPQHVPTVPQGKMGLEENGQYCLILYCKLSLGESLAKINLNV